MKTIHFGRKLNKKCYFIVALLLVCGIIISLIIMNIRGDKMKKLAIYLLMMLSLLMVCFTLFSKIVNAETSKKWMSSQM